MSTFAKVFDPTFEDLADPYRHYNADGEPLEDRLYLPVGFDPAKRVTEVVALHPYPGQDQILLQRTIPTTGLTEAFRLVEETQRLAAAFEAVPVFVFEATRISWRPLRDLFVRLGQPTASAVQVRHLRGTQTRKKKSDAIDALQAAKLFKNGASHVSRIPPEPMASLRELCRAHLFFAEFLVAAQNRMAAQQCVLHPESRTPFTRVHQRTPMALVTHELLAPARLLALSLEELSQLLRQASHGRYGRVEAVQLRQSALTTLAMPPAEAAVSYSLALVGRSYLYLVDQILRPLQHRIRELLAQVPFRHHLDEIPFFGPIVIGTVLGELGHPGWFHTADDVVAWFGLDPAVFASAGKQAAGVPLTKRGSRYGRRILWLAAQNWCKYTTIGRRFFRHYRFGKGLSYDATVCAFAARLARLSWAMLRDGTPYDARRAFQAYLPVQLSARGALVKRHSHTPTRTHRSTGRAGNTMYWSLVPPHLHRHPSLGPLTIGMEISSRTPPTAMETTWPSWRTRTALASNLTDGEVPSKGRDRKRSRVASSFGTQARDFTAAHPLPAQGPDQLVHPPHPHPRSRGVLDHARQGPLCPAAGLKEAGEGATRPGAWGSVGKGSLPGYPRPAPGDRSGRSSAPRCATDCGCCAGH